MNYSRDIKIKQMNMISKLNYIKFKIKNNKM